jgi:hypothetical protein
MLLTAAIVVRETRDTPHLPRLGRRVRGRRARG